MTARRCAVVLLCAVACCLVSTLEIKAAELGPAPADPQPRTGSSIDARIFPDPADRKRLTESWSADIRKRRIAANERETAEWRLVRSRDEWEKFRNARLTALRASLGEGFVEPGASTTPLNAAVTGTIRGAGYQIENVVFDSRPGLVVTANLYAPAEPREKMPGILICHSHHHPKTQSELQEMGILWARAGCLVLVIDQLGHGERRQHPFRSKEDYAGEFRPSRQDYYFRYNVGMQLHVIGESLIGWMVQDLMRGVDLLLSRPGVDRTRIILLGAVAGGGDPAAVTAALDGRITAVVPFNFGGPQPESTYPLPPNAEKTFNYFGGGSWESTRNLRWSVRAGYAPWVIVGAAAPRRLVYAHEFAWDQEHDPVWQRFETIFRLYGEPENLASTHGAGSVRGTGPGNTHCNNIGPEHLVAIHAAFERWFRIPVPSRENIPQYRVDELSCLTGPAAADRAMTPLHELAHEIGAKRAASARERLAKLGPAERLSRLRNDWARLLGDVEPPNEPKVVKSQNPEMGSFPDATTERLALEVEPGIVVPLVLIRPAQEAAGKRPVVVGVAQQGKQVFLDRRSEVIAELLAGGIAVCLPDLRGTGETQPDEGRGRSSSATSLSSAELMLGQTALGMRVRDLRSVLRYLRARPDLDSRRTALWGDSFATANSRERNLAVPLDAAELPRLAEPMGGLVVLLTALFEENVLAVSARGVLVGFQSLLESQFLYVPHDVIVPGALTTGDLRDVAAVLAPRPLQLADLVDGQNRLVSAEDAAAVLEPVKQAYVTKAASRLSLPGSGEGDAAKWLEAALNE